MNMMITKSLFPFIVVATLIAVLLNFIRGESDVISGWNSLPPGDEKLEMAQLIVSKRLLVGQSIVYAREIIGEPDLVRSGYYYYKLKTVSDDDAFDLNGHYFLACHIDKENIDLCVIQGD